VERKRGIQYICFTEEVVQILDQREGANDDKILEQPFRCCMVHNYLRIASCSWWRFVRCTSNQYGPTFLTNAFSTLLNQCHIELRQFWRRKGVKHSI